MGKTLILGVGNPILTDDAAGIKVAEAIKSRPPKGRPIDVKEISAGGLTFLDEIQGYDGLILVDSIKTKGGRPGKVYRLSLEDLKANVLPAPPHGINLPTAIGLGKKLGFKMPRKITVYAIEVEDNTSFGERCTEKVEEAIPKVVEMILKIVGDKG